GGWHHEWGPGIHTLALGGRLENEQLFRDHPAPQLLFFQDSLGKIYSSDTSSPFGVDYHGKLEIYTAELNQIFQSERATLSIGGRYQFGTFDTQVIFTNPAFYVGPSPSGFFTNAVDTNAVSADFERITGYTYLTVEPLDRVWLTGGFAYDDM